MSRNPKPLTAKARRRAVYLAVEYPKLAAEARRLKAEVVTARRDGWIAGSSWSMAQTYFAVNDLGAGASMWLSKRMAAARDKRKPKGLDPEIERAVLVEIAAYCRSRGLKSYLRDTQRIGASRGIVL